MLTSRRSFSTVAFGGTGLAALGLLHPSSAAARIRVRDDGSKWASFPYQPIDLVRMTVGASHRDLEKVKELVGAHPALVNATWDWGFGDWETALGAASHVGRRDIAEFLIASAARPDIFTAAMLGRLGVVQDLISAYPGIQQTRGPHGIPLLAHATAGGEPASAVAAYLTGLGDAGRLYPDAPLTEAERARYLGVYAFGPGADQRFTIAIQKDRLALQKGEEAARWLTHLGSHQFHPPGAPGVRLVFEVPGDATAGAMSAIVTDHDLRIEGTRVPAG